MSTNTRGTGPGFGQWATDYFRFHKWQRRALLLAGIAMVLVVVIPYWIGLKQAAQPATTIHISTVQQLVARQQSRQPNDDDQRPQEDWRQPRSRTDYYATKKEDAAANTLQPFAFDPNTASEATLQQLGLRQRTIDMLLKYRSKGGRFKQPEDLAKLYSLKPEEAAALIPFVRIAAATEPSSSATEPAARTSVLPAAPQPTRPLPARGPVDINLSDTTAWIALPGIGSKLANRIVNFRDKLGGFYSIDQVAETYALPDSTFQKIKSRLALQQPADLRTINLNTATAEELKSHPYFRWNVANAVVQYRQQHGPYKSVADLQKIVLVEAAWLQKISPYLRVQ